VTETYVCPHCSTGTDRTYRVQFIIVTCEECGRNGRFVHDSLLSVLASVPEADRPDDWEQRPLDERLLYAVREGLVTYDDTRVN
jgi:RNase P subunit RPR2